MTKGTEGAAARAMSILGTLEALTAQINPRGWGPHEGPMRAGTASFLALNHGRLIVLNVFNRSVIATQFALCVLISRCLFIFAAYFCHFLLNWNHKSHTNLELKGASESMRGSRKPQAFSLIEVFHCGKWKILGRLGFVGVPMTWSVRNTHD